MQHGIAVTVPDGSDRVVQRDSPENQWSARAFRGMWFKPVQVVAMPDSKPAARIGFRGIHLER